MGGGDECLSFETHLVMRIEGRREGGREGGREGRTYLFVSDPRVTCVNSSTHFLRSSGSRQDAKRRKGQVLCV